MFDKILAALDLNDSYEALFTQALSLAEKTKAKLVLLQALDAEGDYAAPFPYYANGYPVPLDETLWERYQSEYKARKAAGIKNLTALVEIAADAGVEAEFIQAEGDAGRTICKCAQQENVDLVIVGSHGRRGIEEFLMGSVSSYVMHRAPCAVMILKDQDAYAEAIENNHNVADAAAV